MREGTPTAQLDCVFESAVRVRVTRNVFFKNLAAIRSAISIRAVLCEYR